MATMPTATMTADSGGVRTVSVDTSEAGVRLDRWFRRHYPTVAHGRLQKLLRSGQVRVDGRRATAGQRLEPGQVIRVPPTAQAAANAVSTSPPAAPVSAADSKALANRILYRDDALLVLDKPAGLAVQGGTGTRRHLDAMLDALRFGGERPRLVHRLDRDTSGVLILARGAAMAAKLTAAFRSKDVRKLYWALVVGVPKPAMGRIDRPLAKALGRRGERVTEDVPGARRAITDYRIVDQASRRAAWLALVPITGRTHQLRVHCALLGTPIVGDGKYGGARAFDLGEGVGRGVHLHARAVRLLHPATGRPLTVSAPLPEHMRISWDFLGLDDVLPDDDPWDGFPEPEEDRLR